MYLYIDIYLLVNFIKKISNVTKTNVWNLKIVVLVNQLKMQSPLNCVLEVQVMMTPILIECVCTWRAGDDDTDFDRMCVYSETRSSVLLLVKMTKYLKSTFYASWKWRVYTKVPWVIANTVTYKWLFMLITCSEGLIYNRYIGLLLQWAYSLHHTFVWLHVYNIHSSSVSHQWILVVISYLCSGVGITVYGNQHYFMTMVKG